MLSPAPARPGLKRALPLLAPALAMACVLLAWLPASVAMAWEWRRGMLPDGQWWRLWSCHLAHFSAHHALADGAVLLAGTLSEHLLGTRALALRLALAAPLISAGLLLTAPDLRIYRGASGLDTMLFVTAGIALWRQERSARIVLLALAAALALKCAAEARGWSAGFGSLPGGVALAWQAHALGALCGALLAFKNTRDSRAPAPARTG